MYVLWRTRKLRAETALLAAGLMAFAIGAMRAAGWTVSTTPGPGLIVDALWSALEGREDPTVETVAHFWRGQPNALAFGYRPPGQHPASSQVPKARFWRTEYVTPDGQRVFVGTVGLDESGEAAPGGAGPDDRGWKDVVTQGLLKNGATEVARVELSEAPVAPHAASAVMSTAAILSLQ